MNHRTVLFLSSLAALTVAVAPASANEALTGIACRSVHLGYEAPASTAFYNEVRVRDTAPGTYFMTAGWNGGYFGMQEKSDGEGKVVIFSVWDSNETNDPHAVVDKQRVKLIYNDPAVNVHRFGGEGTGGQSFFKYDWKTGETCRFVVAARPAGENRTEYTGFFYIAATKSWKRLVTFSTPTKHKTLTGLYSFVEDFKRSGKSDDAPATWSPKFERRAEYGPGFVLVDNAWKPLTVAKFTGDGNKAVNIDSGEVNGRFFLATGGAVENKHTPLWSKTTLKEIPVVPADLADVAAQIAAIPVTPVVAPAPAAPAPAAK